MFKKFNATEETAPLNLTDIPGQVELKTVDKPTYTDPFFIVETVCIIWFSFELGKWFTDYITML